jgi:hypothetical protein
MATLVTPQPGAIEAADAGREAERAPSRAWAAWAAFGAVGLCAALVFWVYDALPFQDLPAHAGLIAMRHRFPGSPFEQRFFVLAPHLGPYSLFRFLGEGFVRIIGPIGAVRALATLPVVSTPLAMLFARRRLFRDASFAHGYLGIALSFGIMTLLGFASYLLGVAVMLVGLTLWLELCVAADDRTPDLRRREITMAAFGPVMFVAHGHAFVIFLVCAATSCLVAGRRLARIVCLRTLVPALALAAWVAWIEGGTTTPPGSVPIVARFAPLFESAWDKFQLLATPTLMTRTGIDFFASIVVWGFAVACTVLTVRSLRHDAPDSRTSRESRHARALYACAAVIAAVFLALPHSIGWFGFVDGRLIPIILLLAFLGVRRSALPRPLERALDFGAPVVATTIAALAMVASYRFQDEARGYREVLARVPAEARLLNLPLDPNSDVFVVHPFVHYDKLVLADRPIVVSDVWFHQGSALYPTPANPALRLPSTYSESDLRVIDWPAYQLSDWDYVLIRTRPNATQPFTPDALTLEEHAGGWWLFKRER